MPGMAEEAIRVSDQYYILATSARIDDRTRVLKHGDTFAVFDRFGDIDAFGPAARGLYHEDTRFLSRFALRMEGQRPLMLDSSIKDDNVLFTVDLMNADLWRGNEVVIPRGSVHVQRCKVLWQATCFERVTAVNYAQAPIDISFSVQFGADFADLFEVRGTPRQRRGRVLPPRSSGGRLVLEYEGLDGRRRRTRILLDPAPEWSPDGEAVFRVRIEPQGEATLRWSIACEVDPPAAIAIGAHGAPSFETAVDRAAHGLGDARASEPHIHTSNTQFNHWVNRSRADIHLLWTNTPNGPYPYAGVPWYSTVFGRDGIITALECLWMNTELARGVLACLAQTQATEVRPERDAEPGKIIHEMRSGEMAALGEIPFGRYYGSVDATPLFIVLANAYFERTGDLEFMGELWPHVERALEWIDRYGDADGDGFYEYARCTQAGLLHQGWKDSHNAVFHADGTAAQGPIALCEVQGYAYAAKLAAARLADALGHGSRAAALATQGEQLRERFEESFWCEDLGTYALALDGGKRQCRVVTSNAGHCLYSGIASEERAARLVKTLMAQASFSGWGVRTVAMDARGYNPMSYHNGSVWPHDNALIAAGFARYGHKDAAIKVLTGLFDAALHVELHRLPELFCGFTRRPGEAPTLYPVACSPQAWAAGAVFLSLQSCLGLEVRYPNPTVTFSNPVLPSFLDAIQIYDLKVGSAAVDLVLTRHAGDVGISVRQRSGHVSVVTLR
jgi:glycogen debranching enzyme